MDWFLLLFFLFSFSGGVCVLASGNSQHRPLPAVSQECAQRQAVQPGTLRELSDGHHRHAEYRKDWQGVQLGLHRTSLVELGKKKKMDEERGDFTCSCFVAKSLCTV